MATLNGKLAAATNLTGGSVNVVEKEARISVAMLDHSRAEPDTLIKERKQIWGETKNVTSNDNV